MRVEFVRCSLHTLTDYVTSLLRYSENHNVLKGKYPKPLSLFSHSADIMTHRILQREMYKISIFPLAFGNNRTWPLVKHLATQPDGIGFESDKAILYYTCKSYSIYSIHLIGHVLQYI